MKIILIAISVIVIWINIDDFKIKRRITRLTDKVERLCKIVNIKCKLPEEELPPEIKINYLENQIDSLESAILNQNHQETFPKDTQQL